MATLDQLKLIQNVRLLAARVAGALNFLKTQVNTLAAAEVNAFEDLESHFSYTEEEGKAIVLAGFLVNLKGNGVYEVAPSDAIDHNLDYTATGGVKYYSKPTNFRSELDGRANNVLDIQHYSRQGVTGSPTPISVHDYTDAERTMQLDKVGGAAGQYVLGLRRANNNIRRVDKDGEYVGSAGFLRCSYDIFTEAASVLGTISGSILTVAEFYSGDLSVGQFIKGGGIPDGAKIESIDINENNFTEYTVSVRGETPDISVSSTVITASIKSEVLGFYIGAKGDFGWSSDPVKMLTAKPSDGFFAYQLSASVEAQFILRLSSASGAVLDVQDAVAGTRTDIISPANQTSGIRIEALGGGIDLAPKSGSNITMRGPINSQSGQNIVITGIGSKVQLNASFGVESFAPFKLPLYSVATAPSAAAFSNFLIQVSDGDSGQRCLALSNGSDWLRVPVGAAISDA